MTGEASPLRVVSFGGGVQSTSLLVLAAEGRVPHRTFVFANVGQDSEHPATLRYLREVAAPFADRHGLDLVEVRRVRRDGTAPTLWRQMLDSPSGSVPIPVRMGNGAPGRRSCTEAYKVRAVRAWLRGPGASRANPARIAIGFSTDEIHRVARRRASALEVPEYPLIDLGLSRQDCAEVIAAAGLPVPGKSSCYFCPFHRPAEFARMAREEPALFQRAVHLERLVNARRRRHGKDPAWLTRFGKPLDLVVADLSLQESPGSEGPERCDDGYCWT